MKRAVWIVGLTLLGVDLLAYGILWYYHSPVEAMENLRVELDDVALSYKNFQPDRIAEPPLEGAPLEELANWIKPRSCDSCWGQIPWQGSLAGAYALARNSNRMVFLWGSNQPLGRC